MAKTASTSPDPAAMIRLQRWLGHGINAAIALGATVAIVLLQRSTIERAAQGLEDPVVAQDRTRSQLQLAAKLPTLGFDNFLGNWAFLSYLQYFGDSDVRAQTGFTANEDYFEVMTLRDPRFTTLAPFISAGVAYYGAKPEKSVAFMTRMTNAIAPKVQEDGFWVWRFKALDQYLLLNDIPSTIQSLEMAASWAEVNGKNREIAGYFRDSANFLRRDPNVISVRFFAWNEVYQNAVDPLVIQRSEQELVKMGAKRGQRLPNGRYQFKAPSNM